MSVNIVLLFLLCLLLSPFSHAIPVTNRQQNKQILVILPTVFPSPLPSSAGNPIIVPVGVPGPASASPSPAGEEDIDDDDQQPPASPVTSPGIVIVTPVGSPVAPPASPAVTVVPPASPATSLVPAASPAESPEGGVGIVVPVPGGATPAVTPPVSPIPEPVTPQPPQPSQTPRVSQPPQPSQTPQASQPSQPSQTPQISQTPQASQNPTSPGGPAVVPILPAVEPTPDIDEGQALLQFTHRVDATSLQDENDNVPRFSDELNQCIKDQSAASTNTEGSQWALTGVEADQDERGVFVGNYTAVVPAEDSERTLQNYPQYVNETRLDSDIQSNCNLNGVQVRALDAREVAIDPEETPDVAGAAVAGGADVEGDGVSAGRVAGIAAGVIAGAALLALAAFGLTKAFTKRESSSAAAVGGDGSTIFSEDSERRASSITGPNGGGGGTTIEEARAAPVVTETPKAGDIVTTTTERTVVAPVAAAGAAGLGAAGLAAAAAGRSKTPDSFEERGAMVPTGAAAVVAGEERRHPHDWIVGQGPVTERTPLPPEDYVFREDQVRAMPSVEDIEGRGDYIPGAVATDTMDTADRGESNLSAGLPEYEPGQPTYADPPEYGQVIETEESTSTSVTRSASSGRTRSNPPQSPHME